MGFPPLARSRRDDDDRVVGAEKGDDGTGGERAVGSDLEKSFLDQPCPLAVRGQPISAVRFGHAAVAVSWAELNHLVHTHSSRAALRLGPVTIFF